MPPHHGAAGHRDSGRTQQKGDSGHGRDRGQLQRAFGADGSNGLISQAGLSLGRALQHSAESPGHPAASWMHSDKALQPGARSQVMVIPRCCRCARGLRAAGMDCSAPVLLCYSLASWKSTSFPMLALPRRFVMIFSCMICWRMVMSGLVMSTSTSGLLIWLAKPSPITSGR